mmetsp:Transcript_740/g.1510  ORF Transcript_740/g.1510 Transcript_740/m.1510 type:complete len:104 (-) Transcript_740:8-319(-)
MLSMSIMINAARRLKQLSSQLSIHSSCKSFIQSSIHSIIHLFLQSINHPSGPSLIQSSNHPSHQSFIHSIIQSSSFMLTVPLGVNASLKTLNLRKSPCYASCR